MENDPGVVKAVCAVMTRSMVKADCEMEDYGPEGSESLQRESEDDLKVRESGEDAWEWAQEMNEDAHQQWSPEWEEWPEDFTSGVVPASSQLSKLQSECVRLRGIYGFLANGALPKGKKAQDVVKGKASRYVLSDGTRAKNNCKIEFVFVIFCGVFLLLF